MLVDAQLLQKILIPSVTNVLQYRQLFIGNIRLEILQEGVHADDLSSQSQLATKDIELFAHGNPSADTFLVPFRNILTVTESLDFEFYDCLKYLLFLLVVESVQFLIIPHPVYEFVKFYFFDFVCPDLLS